MRVLPVSRKNGEGVMKSNDLSASAISSKSFNLKYSICQSATIVRRRLKEIETEKQRRERGGKERELEVYAYFGDTSSQL